MKDKLLAWMQRTTETGHFLHLIAGGYVAYLGIKVLIDMFSTTGDVDVLLAVLAVILVLAGVAIVLISFYALIKHISKSPKNKQDTADADIISSSDDKESKNKS